MEIYSPKLYIEINNSEYVFAVGDENEKKDFKIIYESSEKLQGIQNNKITDFDLVFNTLKKKYLFYRTKIKFYF